MQYYAKVPISKGALIPSVKRGDGSSLALTTEKVENNRNGKLKFPLDARKYKSSAKGTSKPTPSSLPFLLLLLPAAPPLSRPRDSREV